MLTMATPSVTRVPGNYCSVGSFAPSVSVSGLAYGTSKAKRTVIRVNQFNSCWLPRGRIQKLATVTKKSLDNHVSSAGREHYQLSYADEPPNNEPFWLSLVKEAIWSWRSLFLFLVEQPSQLMHLEWPGFQSTLKTATLTLVLVALLIVALSSVDSVLCYLLALFLRRTA